jgi:hypothetical protein
MSSQSPERAFAPSRALAAFALGTLLLACGRPATEAECKRVVEKNVEVQMRKMNMGDPASIDKEKARILASMGPELQKCIGRKVSDGMMKCVDSAQTPEDIEKCLH